VALAPDVILTAEARQWQHCKRPLGASRSCLRPPAIPSELASSIVWRGRAATSPDLPFSNTPLAGDCSMTQHEGSRQPPQTPDQMSAPGEPDVRPVQRDLGFDPEADTLVSYSLAGTGLIPRLLS
jgi:hypothetical protein